MHKNSGQFIPYTEHGNWCKKVTTGGSKKPSKYHPSPEQSKYIKYFPNGGIPFKGKLKNRKEYK